MKRSVFDFVLTFIIAVVIFAVVAVFVVNFAQGLMSDVVDKVNDGNTSHNNNQGGSQGGGSGENGEKGTNSVVKTFLFMILDENEQNVDTMFLLGINSEEKCMTCMLLPCNTYSLINNTRFKIGELYSSKGTAYIKNFVHTEVGIVPSYYFVLPKDKIGTIVDYFGGIDFEVTKAVSYEDRAAKTKINVKAGKQKLGGDTVTEILTYNGYPKGLPEREDVQISFAKTFFEFFFSKERLDEVKRMYSVIMGGIATDFSTSDFMTVCNELFDFEDYKNKAEFLRAPGNTVSTGHYAIAASKATAKFTVYK